MTSFLSVLAAILLLGVLIFIHELGHYGAARLLGIRVSEFAIGFGPKIVSWEKTGIRYSLRLLPLGGFCSFVGEDEELSTADAFNNQPAWRRLLTQLAGPVLNIVFGLLLAVFILTVTGEAVLAPIVAEVTPNAPAAMSGLLPGDRIIAVNDAEMEDVSDIVSIIGVNAEKPIEIDVLREGKPITLTMTPFYDEAEQRARVGFTFGSERVYVGFGESLSIAANYSVNVVKEVLSALKGMVFKGNLDGMSGPLGTISIISQSVRFGLDNVLHLCVLLSINLGVFNLLPVPGLDGGRIVFTLIEMVRRKPINPDREGMVHLVGLGALVILMVVFTYRDIVGFFSGGG